MKRAYAVLGTVVVAALSFAIGTGPAPAPPPEAPKVKPLSTPGAVVPLALLDARKIETARKARPTDARIPDPQFIRYAWIEDGNGLDWKASAVALGLLSGFSEPTPPVRLPGGYLLRVDLTKYVPDQGKSLARFAQTWEELRFDPAFNKLVTNTTVALLDEETQLHQTKVVRDGEEVTVTLVDLLQGEAARLPSKHIPQAEWRELCGLLGTEAPIVDFRYLVTRGLTAIKAQFGNRTLFGGLYYDFNGFPATEAEFLKFIGVGDGGSLEAFYARLPSERRVGMWKSAVTEKERQVVIFPAETVPTGSWGAITRDPNRENSGGRFSAMRTLIGFKFAASEGIFVSPVGLHWFLLWDGDGKIQEVAPQSVVAADGYRDRFGNRSPHSKELQPAISCIKCHWAIDDSDGWKPLRNDVLALNRRGLVPIADLDLRGRSVREVRDKLVALYKGEPDKLVTRARDDLDEAVLRVSGGPWPRAENQRISDVRLAGQRLVTVYEQYNYEPVDASIALYELGIVPPRNHKDAVAVFNKAVPPTPGGLLEDVAIGSIQDGLYINRYDWAVSYAFVWERMMAAQQRK